MKYLVLEKLDDEPGNQRVIETRDIAHAYKTWLENPAQRTIVKRIELEIREK